MMSSQVDGRRPSLCINSYEGARAMVRHLVSAGHRTIAHLSGPADNFDSHERLRGYRDELAASLAGVEPLVFAGDFSQESGQAAGLRLAELVAQGRAPAAVFAANDMMAIGCLAALEERGLQVPRDVAVAGFDDIPLAAFVRPKLTTMRVDIAELGRLALARLASSLADPEFEAPAQLLRPVPVVRESCGAPLSARANASPRSARHGDPDVQ